MEGQTDDVMLHLMTYPEKDRITLNNMIREGLAKKLEEFDKWGTGRGSRGSE